MEENRREEKEMEEKRKKKEKRKEDKKMNIRICKYIILFIVENGTIL